MIVSEPYNLISLFLLRLFDFVVVVAVVFIICCRSSRFPVRGAKKKKEKEKKNWR
jgi:hypothetical protein